MVFGQEIGPYLVGDSVDILAPGTMKAFPEGTRECAIRTKLNSTESCQLP